MLSSFDIANFGCALALAAVLSYAIYTAFGIRHAFSVRLYRRQALGIGLIALVLLTNFVNNFVLSYFPPNHPTDIAVTNLGVLGLPTFILFFAVLFYWIDASVLVAIKSDPLQRDTLRWRGVRLVLRLLIYGSAVLVIGTFLFAAIFVAVPSGGASASSGGAPAFLAPSEFLLLLGVPVAGVVLLPISARRTKDPLLKKQLYWFGLFALFYILNSFITGSMSNPVQVLFSNYAFNVITAFCLYRSAKSLVPLYNFSEEKVSQ